MPRISPEQKNARRSAIARECAFHAGRLAIGHHPVAILVSVLQQLRHASDAAPLGPVDIEGVLAAVMTETGARFKDGPMGAQLIESDPIPHDQAIAALRDVVDEASPLDASKGEEHGVVISGEAFDAVRDALANFPR